MDEIVKNEYGFYEVAKKPGSELLKAYYTEKYYQKEKTDTYSRAISEEEKTYKYNKVEQRFHYLQEKADADFADSPAFLDVGCGEGFALQYFKQIGWSVTGLEYSAYACSFFHPDCCEDLITGDIAENLSDLADRRKVYDLVWLDNVLEHVRDPLKLLQQVRQLGSFLVVEVPNDFSPLQMALLEAGKIDREFWISLPDHLSYFNKEGLLNIAEHSGWKPVGVLADFPIDWFLANHHSNYVVNKQVGKQAHYARVAIDNLLHEVSVLQTNRLYETLADLGMGRQIVAFLENPEIP